MKIDAFHRLQREPGESQVIYKDLAGGAIMEVRRLAVIHFTAGASALSSIEYWRSLQSKIVSAHVVIERDGTVYQCRPFDRTAAHAGVSAWKDPKTGIIYRNVNSCSIGIELANAGNAKVAWAKAQPGYKEIFAAHRLGGLKTSWECFPEAQLAAAILVTRALVKRYNLDDVVGHEDVSPPGLRQHGDWKPDPGPAFPMLSFRSACGFSGLPETFRP